MHTSKDVNIVKSPKGSIVWEHRCRQYVCASSAIPSCLACLCLTSTLRCTAAPSTLSTSRDALPSRWSGPKCYFISLLMSFYYQDTLDLATVMRPRDIVGAGNRKAINDPGSAFIQGKNYEGIPWNYPPDTVSFIRSIGLIQTQGLLATIMLHAVYQAIIGLAVW